MKVVIVPPEPARPVESGAAAGEVDPGAGPAGHPGRYAHLPAPIKVEDTISSKEATPAADPQLGRDTERDFMLRYAG